jgi:hypothetical protein
MGGVDAVAAIMLLVGFLGGVMAGIVVIVSVASRRDPLTEEAPGPMYAGARRVNGVGVRGYRSDSTGRRPDESGKANRQEPYR